MDIIESSIQTKKWRKTQKWYKGGKKTECEKYQLNLLYNIFKINFKKTNDRINKEELLIENIIHPFKKENGFEYTENFDGKLIINNKIIYLNLKFVCDSGGAQTRTLKNVYEFIKVQYKILHNNDNIIFINILDGNESHKNMDKFRYLQKKKENSNLLDKCYIGDMHNFSKWFNKSTLWHLTTKNIIDKSDYESSTIKEKSLSCKR